MSVLLRRVLAHRPHRIAEPEIIVVHRRLNVAVVVQLIDGLVLHPVVDGVDMEDVGLALDFHGWLGNRKWKLVVTLDLGAQCLVGVDAGLFDPARRLDLRKAL